MVLFLSFLVIILIVLKIVYGDREDNNQVNQITPTPTIIKEEIKPEIVYEALNDGNPDYPLKKVLPYSTDSFSIIGYDEPFTLLVRIKSGDKTEIEKEVKQWIEKYIPGDTDHKIIYAKN